jgi:predicted mannosyl-3-phosphoglycerate phosphatase (HAD superfamily)
VYVCKTINNYYNKTNKMKNLILSAATLLTITFSAAASPVEPVVSEKVQATFTSIFKSAVDVTWSKTANSAEAYFTANDIKTRATFDTKGNLIQTVRYYKEDKLSPVVLAGVASSFVGKEIHGVTEVSNKNGVNYRIVLKDNKHYTHINANSTGDTEVVSKYTRGDK